MFGRKRSKNWNVLRTKGFGETSATRDVQGAQVLERGGPGEKSSKTPRVIISVILAFLIAIGVYGVGYLLMFMFSYYQVLISGSSIVGFSPDTELIMVDKRLWFASVLTFVLGGLIVYERLIASWKSENVMADTTDINPHLNDQHVMLDEQMQETFDWFPDAGGHSSIQVSSMLSHMMLSNKGLKKVKVPRRYSKDTTDEQGVTHYKGEVVFDKSGEVVFETKPLIDEEFGQELLTASGIPIGREAREVRIPYDVRKVSYNPPVEGSGRSKNPQRIDRDKLNYDTVADLINDDWYMPAYEVQRPAGAYLVDTAPINTMVLAITRGGKGQTVIEPTIDMWTREKRQNNIVINDPKGELLVMFYVPATVRGYEIIQFNLINVMKTDVYNPIGFAAEFARQGDFTKAAAYVENIGDIFFPVDGADDPMWPNAANNAFKRTVFGLIDFYLEEEKQLRRDAEVNGLSEKVLTQKLDDMWGKVSLYNAYQLFVVLSSKKSSDEEVIKIDVDEDVKEKDYLTLFFDASAKLPANQMRSLVNNSDKSLRAMAGSDKTISSVYGIAITGMSFFVDPTISTLTSGKPSQNFDVQGLAFPRRMGVRFAPEFLKRYPMAGLEGKWSAYEDAEFTKPYDDKLYGHSQLIDPSGWARYFFDGIFPKRKNYIKLEIRNPDTGLLSNVFYFELMLTYKTTLNGRSYVKDPVLKDKIIRDGLLRELLPNKKTGKFEYKDTMVDRRYRNLNDPEAVEKIIRVPAISQKVVNYTEKPKMVYFITPPHLQAYAKLILILIKQMVDSNFESSYITKSSQKPLYKTRYMLDELGNLQSEGSGIPGLATMLSIGLGQDQQFTLILQTLQQLRDVYGESVDKVIQGNVANIVFLKSTDGSMIETLEKMSGQTHESLVEQKTFTQDNNRMLGKMDSPVSYTMSTKQRSVIQYNDMLFIPPRNSMVFRAGESPVWNRRSTILPMSWRLLKDTIIQPGVSEYSLQTVPTLSTALDFDIRNNQPDFYRMLNKRVEQARLVDYMRDRYMEVYKYTEDDMARLDPEVVSDEIMIAINENLYGTGVDRSGAGESTPWGERGFATKEAWQEANAERESESTQHIVEVSRNNDEMLSELSDLQDTESEMSMKVHAGGRISKRMLVTQLGNTSMELSSVLAIAYEETKQHFGHSSDYIYNDTQESLRDAKSGETYVVRLTDADVESFKDAAVDGDSRVFSEEPDLGQTEVIRFEVKEAFIRHLYSLSSWSNLAGGRFESEVGKVYDRLKSLN